MPAPQREVSAGRQARPRRRPSCGTSCLPPWGEESSGQRRCSSRSPLPCSWPSSVPWGGVVLVRGQEHLQRKLLMPPVRPKLALAASPRCTVFVVATHRHADHWAPTKDHTKRAIQTCRASCRKNCLSCRSRPAFGPHEAVPKAT